MAIRTAGGDRLTDFDTPSAQGHPIAERGEEGAIVAQGEHGGCRGGGTFTAEERSPNALGAAVLVGEQTQDESALAQSVLERGGFETAFEKEATGLFADGLEHLIEGGRIQGAVGGGELVSGHEPGHFGKELEVAEVPDGKHEVRPTGTGGVRAHVFQSVDFQDFPQAGGVEGGGFYGASEVLADAPEVFAGEGSDLRGGEFGAEAVGEVIAGHSAVPRVEAIDKVTAYAAEPGQSRERQGLEEFHQSARGMGQEPVHGQRKQIWRTQS